MLLKTTSHNPSLIQDGITILRPEWVPGQAANIALLKQLNDNINVLLEVQALIEQFRPVATVETFERMMIWLQTNRLLLWLIDSSHKPDLEIYFLASVVLVTGNIELASQLRASMLNQDHHETEVIRQQVLEYLGARLFYPERWAGQLLENNFPHTLDQVISQLLEQARRVYLEIVGSMSQNDENENKDEDEDEDDGGQEDGDGDDSDGDYPSADYSW